MALPWFCVCVCVCVWESSSFFLMSLDLEAARWLGMPLCLRPVLIYLCKFPVILSYMPYIPPPGCLVVW